MWLVWHGSPCSFVTDAGSVEITGLRGKSVNRSKFTRRGLERTSPQIKNTTCTINSRMHLRPEPSGQICVGRKPAEVLGIRSLHVVLKTDRIMSQEICFILRNPVFQHHREENVSSDSLRWQVLKFILSSWWATFLESAQKAVMIKKGTRAQWEGQCFQSPASECFGGYDHC